LLPPRSPTRLPIFEAEEEKIGSQGRKRMATISQDKHARPIFSPKNRNSDAISTTNAFVETKSIFCSSCKYIKLKNHKCREQVFKKTGIQKLVKFCEKHKENDPYNQAGIPMDKIVGI